MTPPGKSAALRLPPYEEDRSDGSSDLGFEAAIRNTASARAAARTSPQGSARDKLLAFPGFEASRPSARTEPVSPPRAEPASEAEFGSELEAALMSDLQSMVALFDEVARDPAPQPPAAPIVRAVEPQRTEAPEAAAITTGTDPDQEALERLLASIRQGDGAPRREPLPADLAEPARPAFTIDDLLAEAPAEVSAATPRRDPTSPRPSARDERMAPPIPRSRKPIPAKAPAGKAAAGKPLVAKRVGRGKLASRAEPVPALRLADSSSARRGYLKPAIALSALIVLAAIGAGMTIRALTARNDTAPSLAETSAPATASAATTTTAAVPATSPAPAAKTAAEPLTQSEAPAGPVAATPRLAVDNSLPAASTAAPAAASAPPAETAAATAAVAAPAPRVPLEPMVMAAPEPIKSASASAALPAAAEAAPDLSDQGADGASARPAAAVATPKLATTASAAGATGGLPAGPARIASGVKLRTNPDNGAPVIAVLAQGAAVDVVSCKGWCEIVAGDKRGFVYQKFLAKAGG